MFVKNILCTQNFVKITGIVKCIWLHGIQFLLQEYLPVSREIFFLFLVLIEAMCSLIYVESVL